MSLFLAPTNAFSWETIEFSPLTLFFIQTHQPNSLWPTVQLVKENNLPHPFNFLLTQPIMTQGIAEYYQRKPQVRSPLYALEDQSLMTYSRAIIMIVDNNQKRNDATLADQLNQSTITELGLITINQNSLPEGFLTQLQNTHHPFGSLLLKYQIKTQDTHRDFFKIECNDLLHKYLNCKIGTELYGRTNTLVNEQGIWIARAVEILTGYPAVI